MNDITGSGRFSNAGTFRKSVGSGTLNFASGGYGLSFNNTGLVDVQSGTIQISGGIFPTNNGTINTVSGTTFSTGGYGLINAGVIQGNGTIDLGGATLTNNGAVRPGGPSAVGTLSLTGAYSQGASGSLDIDVQTAGSYDVLAISGSASLNGTLNVVHLTGATVGAGATLTPLTFAGSLSGDFSVKNFPSGVAYSTLFNPNYQLNLN